LEGRRTSLRPATLMAGGRGRSPAGRTKLEEREKEWLETATRTPSARDGSGLVAASPAPASPAGALGMYASGGSAPAGGAPV